MVHSSEPDVGEVVSLCSTLNWMKDLHLSLVDFELDLRELLTLFIVLEQILINLVVLSLVVLVFKKRRKKKLVVLAL